MSINFIQLLNFFLIAQKNCFPNFHFTPNIAKKFIDGRVYTGLIAALGRLLRFTEGGAVDLLFPRSQLHPFRQPKSADKRSAVDGLFTLCRLLLSLKILSRNCVIINIILRIETQKLFKKLFGWVGITSR